MADSAERANGAEAGSEGTDGPAAYTGGMVALMPDADSAARIAADTGADPDDLHLTVVYLGSDAASMDSATRAALAQGCADMASAGPVSARIMGHATFNPDGGPDGDMDPAAVYLVSDSPALATMRAALSPYASPTQHEPFLPHITAAQPAGDTALNYTGPVQFDRLRIAMGDQGMDYPLTNGEEKSEPAQVEFKRVVASQAGVRRYGKPIGTQLGAPRDAAAADAQKNTDAVDAYRQAVNGDPGHHVAQLSRMDIGQLGALTRVAYSFKSSDPKVVALRIRLANELAKRGLDVRHYGALGAGPHSGSQGGAPKRKVPKHAVKKPAQTTRTSGMKSVADGLALDVADLADFAELKREFSSAKRDKMADSGKAMDDGSYPIENIKDLKNAISAYGRADESKRSALRAHIRKRAEALHAENMIPDGWSTNGKSEVDYAEDLSALETKRQSHDPNYLRLVRWWAHGPGVARWQPGVPHDFDRLVAALRVAIKKPMTDRELKGLAANIHKAALGVWPGQEDGHKGLMDITDSEYAAMVSTEMKADAPVVKPSASDDPEDTDSALDRYQDFGDTVTSEDAYLSALQDDIAWELLSSGNLANPDDASDDGTEMVENPTDVDTDAGADAGADAEDDSEVEDAEDVAIDHENAAQAARAAGDDNTVEDPTGEDDVDQGGQPEPPDGPAEDEQDAPGQGDSEDASGDGQSEDDSNADDQGADDQGADGQDGQDGQGSDAELETYLRELMMGGASQ